MGKNISKYRYTGDEKFKISKFDTADKSQVEGREQAVDEFVENLRKINKLQQALYAARKEGVIFVFQAMDAAGKDGVIRTVFSSLTPHGVKEYCFKVPSSEESAHNYLWRFGPPQPAHGHISIFNRSYYEDVLVGKVHKLYKNQARADRLKDVDVIEARYKEIVNFEQFLYNNSTRVVKIFLNVSKDEQARRFISRIDTPSKNWKVSSGDIEERKYWDDYMEAFETMVNKTSTKTSPWYVVPADHKWYARLIVSRIVLQTLEEMDPQYPVLADEEKAKMAGIRAELVKSLGNDTDLLDENVDDTFSKTENVVRDMFIEEEGTKVIKKAEKKKKKGFKMIRRMLASGYIVKNPDAIVNAVAEGMEAVDDVVPAPEAEIENAPAAEETSAQDSAEAPAAESSN